MAENRILNLKSSDDHDYQVSYKIMRRSKMISDMMDNGLITDDDDSPIPIMKVDGATLEKIIEWLTYHQNDEDNETGTDEDELEVIQRRTDDIPEWDMEFLNIDQASLFKVILAANYLDIKGLLDVSCKTVANMIKGKTVEELKKTFHITNNFTPEEIEEIKKENEWCEKE